MLQPHCTPYTRARTLGNVAGARARTGDGRSSGALTNKLPLIRAGPWLWEKDDTRSVAQSARAGQLTRYGTVVAVSFCRIRKGPTAFAPPAQHQTMQVAGHKEGFLYDANRTHVIPTLFLIGGQKCGSSAVYRSLIDHPLLATAALGPNEPVWQQKEPNFFSSDHMYKR